MQYLSSKDWRGRHKYTVHWFDDTRTDVTMDSNITDYRYTADYFNGHHMVEKKTRRRKT